MSDEDYYKQNQVNLERAHEHHCDWDAYFSDIHTGTEDSPMDPILDTSEVAHYDPDEEKEFSLTQLSNKAGNLFYNYFRYADDVYAVVDHQNGELNHSLIGAYGAHVYD